MIYISEILEGVRHFSQIPEPTFSKEYDIIVCGLGTSGSLAALFSAENGLSVLGVESFTCLGGTHTAGGVPGHYFGSPGGRYEELDRKVSEFAERYSFIETESRKLLLEENLNQQGVEILYESSVCGVYLEENTVIGVKVITDGGMRNFKAKVVMDCTAEAYVAAIAGCKTEYGRTTDGQMQPYSLVSMLFDGQKYGGVNVDFGRVNQFDRESLSEAVIFARSCKMEECFAERELISQRPLLGIREGRRIISEETVKLCDLLEDKQTQEPMFFSYADLDKHGWDIAFDSEVLGDWAIGSNLGAYNVTVAVPYKAILPLGFEGILVPCRALGVDRDVSSCVRMNLDMKKVSEVAAEWATLAVQQNLTLREVDYLCLQQKLRESGCLKSKDNRGYRIDGKRDWNGAPLVSKDVYWITLPEDLEQRLKTEKPGEAIWSAKKMGKIAIPCLHKLLDSSNENLRKHSAFALAILGDHSSLTVLRDIVCERDGLMLKDCRKNNNLRGCMAVYWLGRLGDRGIASELIELISNENEIKKPVYHQGNVQTTRYKINDFNDVYFQFVSESVMALIRIGTLHSDLRSDIAKGFRKAFSSEDYYYRFTNKPKMSSEGNMVSSLRTISFSSIEEWNL